MNIISEKVLNKIKAEKMIPMSAWKFRVRDGSKWLGLGLFISLTIIAIGLLIFFWSDGPGLNDGYQGVGLLFGRMPLVFIALILLGGLFALIDFKNIGRGYRYSLKVIALILITITLSTGWLFYSSGLSQELDAAISKAPFYQDRQMYMIQVWQQPSEGRLTGEITKVESGNNFELRDFTGKTWAVSSLGATWRHNLQPVVGLQIKLLGSQLGSSGFETTDIRPFMPISGGCGIANGQGTCGMMQ